MLRPIVFLLLLAPFLAAQDDRDALRDALRQRDAEIQRLQRELAERDIELGRLRRLVEDIRMLLDMSGTPAAEHSIVVETPKVTETAPTRPPLEGPPVESSGDPTTPKNPERAAGATAEEIAQWLEDLGAKGKMTRDLAIDALAALGEGALDRLDGIFAGGSLQARRSAAFVVGKIGSPKGVPLLERGLADTDVKVRLYSVSALGEIDSPSSSLLLIQSLEDVDPGVRMTSAALLTERYGKDFDDDAAAWRAWAEQAGLR